MADPTSNPAAIDFGIDDIAYDLPSLNYFQITVVPEPSAMCLGGVGLAVLFVLGLKKPKACNKMTTGS